MMLFLLRAVQETTEKAELGFKELATQAACVCVCVWYIRPLIIKCASETLQEW